MPVDVTKAQQLIGEMKQLANDLYDEAVAKSDLADAAGPGGPGTAKEAFERARDAALSAAQNWHVAIEQLQRAISIL